jgi:hypothetical protein
MCANFSIGNTPNIPQFIQLICPNWPIIWDISEKNVHCPWLASFQIAYHTSPIL